MSLASSVSLAMDADTGVYGSLSHAPTTERPALIMLTANGDSAFLHFHSIEEMTLFGLAIVEEARRLLDVQQRTNPTLPQLLADGDAENAEYRARQNKVVGS